jgi:hypothetical protein
VTLIFHCNSATTLVEHEGKSRFNVACFHLIFNDIQSNGCGVATSFELYGLWIWLFDQQQQSTWGGVRTHGDGVWGILVKHLLDASVHRLPEAIASFVNVGESVVRHDENEGMQKHFLYIKNFIELF